MSCALVPLPTTSTRLPFQSAPLVNWLECTTVPVKSFRPGSSGI